MDYYPDKSVPISIRDRFDSRDKVIERERAEARARVPEVQLRDRQPYTTEPNSMGLMRIYPDRPTSDPDSLLVREDLFVGSNAIRMAPPSSGESHQGSELSPPPFAPFPSVATFLLTYWANTGPNHKREIEIDRLIKDVILDPEFVAEDLRGFSVRKAKKLLDKVNAIAMDPDTEDSDTENATGGWSKQTVKIRVPVEGVKHTKEDKCPEIEIEGLHFRSLVEVCVDIIDRSDAHLMHHTPFREYWKPTEDAPSQRVFGEFYTSDSWLEAHEELQTSPWIPHDDIENVVLPIMISSDSTHLTSFGDQSLWPVYAFPGGHSKYRRAKPSTETGYHVAYMPSVS